MAVLSRLQKKPGFWIFSAISLWGMGRLLLQEIPGHYRVFTEAGAALWRQEAAYQTTFGTEVGYYFYSPFCGLFVFGPFSLLPEPIGLGFFIGLSWLVFVAGARQLFRQFQREAQLPLFLLLVAPSVYSAILASKLELLMTGILFFVASDLLMGKWIRAAFLAAMILNWKFQPLPSLGLMWVASWATRRSWKLAGASGLFWLVFLGAPFAVLSADYLGEQQRQWMESLGQFALDSFRNFDNLFKFLEQALGWAWSWPMAQGGMAVVAMGFLGLLIFARLQKRVLKTPADLLLGAMGMGAVFTTSFSPLHQNNAYVLLAPFWIWWMSLNRKTLFQKILFWMSWVGIALGYSDLVPWDWQQAARNNALKPIWVFSAMVPVTIRWFGEASRLGSVLPESGRLLGKRAHRSSTERG